MVSFLPKMLASNLYFAFTQAVGYVLNSHPAVSAVSVSTHLQLLLLLCGDIELNPGPIIIAVTSRPKLHELDLIKGPNGKTVRVLKDGANKWEEIATRLYFEGGAIIKISRDSSDASQACRTMFIKWLEGENELRVPRTWDTVITVLNEAGLGELAENLEAILTGNASSECHDVAPSPAPDDSQLLQKPSSKHSLVVPDQTQWTFPLLDTKSEEYEKLKIRLYSESCALMEKFVYLFTSFFQSMSDRQIPIKKIIANLKTFGAFTPIYKSENQPLLKDELNKLKLETTDIDMDDIMSTVTDYCSFFNYRLLSFLVEKHGTTEDKKQLDKYEKQFSDYAQRRVFECPSEFGEMNKKFANLEVKLDDHYEQCTMKQLWLLEADLCKIFSVTHLNLRLLRPGCLQLTFQLPFFMQKAIFPLSKEQEEKLLALHVLRVDCEGYHFPSEDGYGEIPNEFQVEPASAQCTDCHNNGDIALLCKKHFICENCLEDRATDHPDSILKCATCLMATPKRKSAQATLKYSFKDALLKPREKASSSATVTPPKAALSTTDSSKERCWIFAYDSNIWIAAKKLQSRLKKFKTGEDHRVRIDMGKLGDVLANGRTIVNGTLYGSEPPRIDTVWKKIEESGWKVEKRQRDEISGKETVHTKLVADVVEVAFKTPVDERSTIILVTGDADIIPAIEVIFDNDKYWKIEVYMWNQAISRKFNPTRDKYAGRLKIEKLDDYIDHVTFTSMKFNTSNQAFSTEIHNNGVVFVMEHNAFPDHVPTYDWVRQLEDIAKWPFQYYWMTENDDSKTNNLVIVFRRDEKAGRFNIEKFLKNLAPITHSTTQPYHIPMVQRAVLFKDFEKELNEAGKEEETKPYFNFEQVGSFTREDVYQGFHNGLAYYIDSHKPGPIYHVIMPIIEWYYAYASLQ